jgi:hypothetical protein
MCQAATKEPKETCRSTDAELLCAMLEIPKETIEDRKEDMEKQISILQKVVDKVRAIQLIPGPASEEINLKSQMVKKIQTFVYLSNVELTLLNHATEAAMHPPGYLPPRLLCTRRQWLRQRAVFEDELRAPCRYIEEKKEHIFMLEAFESLVEDYPEVVLGDWPLTLTEVEWDFVEYP